MWGLVFCRVNVTAVWRFIVVMPVAPISSITLSLGLLSGMFTRFTCRWVPVII